VVQIAALAVALTLTVVTAAGAQPPPDAEALLLRVGKRIAEFYTRAKNLICIEKYTVQAVDLNNLSVGFPRTVESELYVDDGEAPGEAVFVRKVRKVNGRVPRDQDGKDRAGCTDLNPLTSEPLAFLLPAHRSEYRFSLAGTGKDRNETAFLIDFASVNRRSAPELIEDRNGHDDCFDWSGHIATKGRIWVNADTDDVVRVDRWLVGPVDVKVPALLERRYHFDRWIALIRDDLTIRYKTVAFSDPDEVLLLPESIGSYTVIRGGLQSTRRYQTFSGYRRFVTKGKVVTSSRRLPIRFQ
jgi:hypothetical protein